LGDGGKITLHFLLQVEPCRREMTPATAAGGKGSGPGGRGKAAAGAGNKRDASGAAEAVRRSGRIRNQPAPIYTSFEVDEDLGEAHARAGKRRAADASHQKSAKSVKAPAPPAENSIKTLDAQMRQCAEAHLGSPICPTDGTGAMKAAVIHALSPIANPRFSKYSGIQEWANCVCLFVNVGDKNGNSYDNLFTHAGGRITWFAQPRQHEETPVIEKIVCTGDAELDDLADETAPEALALDAEVTAAEAAVTAAEAAVAAAEGAVRSKRGGGSGGAAAAAGNRDEAASGGKTKDDGGGGGGGGGGGCGPVHYGQTVRGGGGGDRPVWPLHLFCRMEGCEYVYCGRLRRLVGQVMGCTAVDQSSLPIARESTW
jgi:hypothetical protein